MDMTGQRSTGLKTAIAAADADRTEPAGEEVREKGLRREFVGRAFRKADDVFRIICGGIAETTVVDGKLLIHNLSRWLRGGKGSVND
jgi:hypothetical protein